ncbi:hypothetical protein GALMADRAFT_769055 [Galerina marginata CBS 339.88]|uniref:Uncharacterized protein n=1 Tax=Galerina marginata (strain CBS 339.88) TaxID=685588 RepID=A0A067SN28_GALM3|nr:hypothetical protein GALMADRAFT_769055 [Galerina marginata CBS 339.88]
MPISNTIFSVFAFIGFLFCAIPLTWHLRNGNTGMCLLMTWLGVSCLYQFINSIVWNGNVGNWSPVWCDIGIRIYLGSGVGIPASTLCIFRRLYRITRARGTIPIPDKSEKRRQIMFDLALGLGLPVLELLLAYISEGHRYNILEDIGCTPAFYNSPVFVALSNTPPILIGLVTARYAVLTIIAFNRRRIEFKELLEKHSNLTSAFYVRLMCFACLELLWTIPVASFFLYVAVKVGLQPWTNWDDVHFNFSRVVFVPRTVWESDRLATVTNELGRWLGVIGAFNFFAFFGFAEEARMNYRAAYRAVAKVIGISTASSEQLGDLRPTSKKNDIDIGALIFAHTANTASSMSISDVEAQKSVEKEDSESINDHIYSISPTIPEPALIKSKTFTIP